METLYVRCPLCNSYPLIEDDNFCYCTECEFKMSKLLVEMCKEESVWLIFNPSYRYLRKIYHSWLGCRDHPT